MEGNNPFNQIRKYKRDKLKDKMRRDKNIQLE